MSGFILDLRETGQTKIALVGGKGANLGELSRIAGIQVPAGFCITTQAFKEITGNNQAFNSLLDQLAMLTINDRSGIRETTARIRKLIEETPIPESICHEIARHLEQPGETTAYAVRSSATAEDLPAASFAGQQDTWLNVIGTPAILRHISRCWASLFTERAVIYRLQNGFDHRKAYLSVIVQRMVFAQAAGILFTADPVSSNRKVSSIDAAFGLGEAIVSGMVNADNYKVRNGVLTDKKIAIKKLAHYAAKDGGTAEQAIGPAKQDRQVLTDEQILQLEHIGRKIEAHFGSPQDIEWCFMDDAFYIVQSRPITTLFPIPAAPASLQPGVNEPENRVYLSVGHQQMMTDPMKPLGLSAWLLLTPATMRAVAARLFVDVTPMLASPAGRTTIIDTLGKFDPLIKDALTTLIERGDFLPSLPDEKKEPPAGESSRIPPTDFQTLKDYDPSVAADLVIKSETAIAALKQNIQTRAGTDLFDFIQEDIRQLKQFVSDPQSMGIIMTAMNAAAWINEKMKEWLGEKNAADTLSQSLPNNVTSEMGLALLDVADVIRPYPAIVAYLQKPEQENFLDELTRFDGGQEARNAIENFLGKYGMRCAGEIDITRTRWSEKPGALVPLILSNVRNFEHGAGARKFEQGRREALEKEQELLTRLKQLPDGEQKASETKRMIGLVRHLAGYREYPKYSIVSRYFLYKQALMKEAGQLVQSGVIREKEDIYYLTFEELREVVRTNKADQQLILQRKDEYRSYEKLTPPRVITSDGEIIMGRYKREDLPAGAIPGLAVSSGVIEGRARVILNMEDADIEDGDILVTTFTDPSWTPLFVSVKGLVTEVGGLMTHGAVIAREYGLPAIVGVDHATTLIKDGQRIRLNGTDGFVEILGSR